MSKTTRTAELQKILEWVETGKGSLQITAFAGCGKTTALLDCVDTIIRLGLGQVALMAFNRPIADELTDRLTKAGINWKQAQANTVHGFGLSALKKQFPKADWNKSRLEVDESKVNNLLRSEMDADMNFASEVFPYANMIVKMIDMAKNRALGVIGKIENHLEWFSIINDFQLDEDLEGAPDLEYAIEVAIRFYKKSLELCKTTSIDYADMILAPLYFKARFWQFDWVMLDEDQDTNPARRALAKAILRPGGRFIGVGDPYQAIYGFTGADFNAIDKIKKEFDCTDLSLSMSWRCPKTAIRRAQRMVPGITAHPDAIEGSERTVWYVPVNENEPSFWDEKFQKTDAILCRNTKPLVETAYALLRRGVACRIEGRAIGEGLIRLVNKWKKIKSIGLLLDKLVEYKESEIAKWMAKGKEMAAEEISDRIDTVNVLGESLLNEGKTAKSDLVDKINSMFGDTKGKVQDVLVLSTIHKAKGKEWNRVYVLGEATLQPSKYARTAEQKQQEDNLIYVAVTRTKDERIDVVYVPKAKKRKEA